MSIGRLMPLLASSEEVREIDEQRSGNRRATVELLRMGVLREIRAWRPSYNNIQSKKKTWPDYALYDHPSCGGNTKLITYITVERRSDQCKSPARKWDRTSKI